MENFKKLSAICCLLAILNYHCSDADFTAFIAPTASGIVTSAVAGTGTTWTAAFMLEDGAISTDTLTSVTSTAGTPGYITASTEFDVHATSGAITVDAAHMVDYSTKSSYSLVITAVDSDATTTTGTITITITVNAKPTFASPTMCWDIAADAAVGETLGTYTASTVESGQTVTIAVAAAGNTNTDFSATMTSGKLVTAKTLAEIGYMLTITAIDNGAAPSTGSILVFVRRGADGATTEPCSGTVVLLGSSMTVLAVLMAQFM